MRYLPHDVQYLHIFKDRRPKDHYTKNYDSKDEILHFQNVEMLIVLVDKEYNYVIIKILMYDAIPHEDLEELMKEVEWLESNANECQQGPTKCNSKMCIFGWRKNFYKNGDGAYGKYAFHCQCYIINYFIVGEFKCTNYQMSCVDMSIIT